MTNQITTPHLILFTVGPVQSFIAQARKTRDLYAGSALLSELIKVAIMEVGKQHIIFPYVAKEESLNALQSLPNRFIAHIEILPQEAQGYGAGIEVAVRQKFREIAQEVLGNQDKPVGFDEQIEAHLDIHWVVQEIAQNSHYQESFVAIEEHLGASKNIRGFSQFAYADTLGEAGRKCNLDGERNALFFGAKAFKTYKTHKQWNKGAKKLTASNIFIAENEGLSAVSYLKRFYDHKKKISSFPSTTSIVLMEAIRHIDPAKIKAYQNLFNPAKAIEECKSLKVNGMPWTRFDDQFYYEENLVPKHIPHTQQLCIAHTGHRKLTQAFAQNKAKFHKYYAVLLFDVDKMGAWLSGTKLKEGYQKDELKIFHQEFSGLLLEYAKETRKILNPKAHNGQVVYAGGDDFLGFVNLHHLFEVVSKLRTTFAQKVSSLIIQKYAEKDAVLHFSAGIVIAHHKAPFSEVLKKARQLETLAKSKGDRNAFAIATMKHSGEIQETVLRWTVDKEDNIGTTHWQSIATIAQYLKDGAVSNKFIFNLSVELYQLAGIKSAHIIEPQNKALFTEMKRLLDRAANPATPNEITNKLWEALVCLYRASEGQERPVQNFIHCLQIADFISRNS